MLVRGQEYGGPPIDAQNSWGCNKGQELPVNIANEERKMGLVTRFTTLRSLELVLKMAERALHLE